MKLKRFCLVLLTAVLLLCTGNAQAGSAFSSKQMKEMSVFLSNFTELGFMNIDTKKFLDEAAPGEMIRFGIWHNYVNNFNSRIKQCRTKDCKWGSLTIDGKYVQESLKQYFDYTLKKLPNVEDTVPACHYDGRQYHFEGADGEAVYYACVSTAETSADGLIVMRGELYNAEDRNDILGTFTATARPHKWNGRDTWALVSLKTHNEN